MAERDRLERSRRRLDPRKRSKALVGKRLVDRAQPIGALRMAGWREVVEASGMGDQERGHRTIRQARAIGYSRGVRQRPITSAAGPARRCLFPSLPGDADAGRWRGLIWHEERRRERLGRVHAIFLEIGDALGREAAIVDEKIAGKAA